MIDTESTCLNYIMERGIRGREEEIMKMYYLEHGILEEMIDNADNTISSLSKLSVIKKKGDN